MGSTCRDPIVRVPYISVCGVQSPGWPLEREGLAMVCEPAIQVVVFSMAMAVFLFLKGRL